MAGLRTVLAGGLLTCLVTACPSKKSPPASAPSPPAPGPMAGTSAPAAPAPPPVADPEASAELIVGSKRGLEAWRRDGGGKRMISAGVALFPRFIDQANVLVVKPAGRDENLAKGGQLLRIALANGKRTKVATLPPFACAQDDTSLPPPDDDPEDGSEAMAVANPPGPAVDFLTIQDEADFGVNETGHTARIVIMDRNANMVEVSVEMRVDLKTGKVERWLTLGQDRCTPPAGVAFGEPPENLPTGQHGPAQKSPAQPQPSRVLFEQEQIFERGSGAPNATAKPVARVPGYEPEQESPSGRWQVLGGEIEEGDYIHRKLVLLDLTTGALFPIAKQGGPWPDAIKRPDAFPGKPAPIVKTPIAKTVSVVGETDIRWLGTTAASELLVVGDLVLKPEARGFKVNGRIAR